MYNIHLLPASFGDSLLIEYGEPSAEHYILIDGGPSYALEGILSTLKRVAPDMKEIELLVVTHVDIDHIEGIIRLLNQTPAPYAIKEIWFNGYEELEYEEKNDLLGGLQGEYLSLLSDKSNLNHNTLFDKKPVTIHRKNNPITLCGGMELMLLSPTQKALHELKKKWMDHLEKYDLDDRDEADIWEKINGDYRYTQIEGDDLLGDDNIESLASTPTKEDTSQANRSSIAFIASYDGKQCFFAGDAISKDILDSLKHFDLLDEFGNLYVDAWKLSHHGSKKSTQDYLLKTIQAKKFMISSDGKRYHHPDKETIAKLLVRQENNIELYFNYKSEYSSIWDDDSYRDEYNYDAFFPEAGEDGYRLIVL